jgi:hypothetical protein
MPSLVPGIRGRVVDLVAKLAEEPAPLVEADGCCRIGAAEGTRSALG